MNIEVDTEELMKDLNKWEVSVAKPIQNGTLTDGRPYQIQVVITTDEDDFIDEE